MKKTKLSVASLKATPVDVSLKPLALAVCLMIAGAASAQTAKDAAAPGHEKSLKAVLVSSTRTEASADDVAASADVIDADAIDKSMAGDLKGIMKYQAEGSVRFQPNRSSVTFYNTGRGGNEGVNIRGMEGNRVLLQVDGVRLPMTYDNGPFMAGRGDYIDPEAFKQVEILRGSSSTAHGSDGLAGSVSFVTKDPQDLLTLGKPVQMSIKTTYSSADKSTSLVPSIAFAQGDYEGMFLASVRRGSEVQTAGTNDTPNYTRTTANPQDRASDYLLGKLNFKIDASSKLKLTVEDSKKDYRTNVLSLLGDTNLGIGVSRTEARATEDVTRSLLKLDYEFDNPSARHVQKAKVSVFAQKSDNAQYGFEQRTSAAPAYNSRDRLYAYGEDATGVSMQAESLIKAGASHRLVYGLDLTRTQVDTLASGGNYRDGVALTGSSGFAVNKQFPDTAYNTMAAFVTDEMAIGKWLVTPGLRYEKFSLTPKQSDPLYAVNNALTPATLKGDVLSPKLAVMWQESALVNPYFQYAHGFRAPTPTLLNGGVTNLTSSQPYKFVGNSALKPEFSNTLELGFKGNDGQLRYSANIFNTEYTDFISIEDVSGAGTTANPTIKQAVNLSGAKVRGFEASLSYAFRPDWLVTAAYAHASGTSVDKNGSRTDLLTINPDKLVLSLKYDQPQQYGAQMLMTAVSARKNPTSTNYSTAGFAVLDLAAWYHFNKNTSVNAGLFNVFDKKYALWADIRSLSASSPVADAYTQTGRNFAVSLKHQF